MIVRGQDSVQFRKGATLNFKKNPCFINLSIRLTNCREIVHENVYCPDPLVPATGNLLAARANHVVSVPPVVADLTSFSDRWSYDWAAI